MFTHLNGASIQENLGFGKTLNASGQWEIHYSQFPVFGKELPRSKNCKAGRMQDERRIIERMYYTKQTF
jgi:hypothetical protein